ncbi:hypothetical protein PoB_007430400 [Plakobranchus ocellatus]|uniref:Uncharacterized protein n=1 Tax=Plakobranchus ocellatus TaxID=259542 RepID=A0AAV4DU92_9GAST|nr:hypothetical protein PoB_007430400 [Plakobranchus ocellatus]
MAYCRYLEEAMVRSRFLLKEQSDHGLLQVLEEDMVRSRFLLIEKSDHGLLQVPRGSYGQVSIPAQRTVRPWHTVGT